MNNAGIYLRVSTLDQDPENQRREVVAFCKARNYPVAGIYQDQGLSGATMYRPDLKRLLQDAFLGKFQIVVAWDLSRLARSALDALQILRRLQESKVRLILLKQQLDTETPTGKALFTMLALFAEMERDLIAERVRARLVRANEAGRFGGRPRVVIDIERAKALLSSGKALRKVAELLGVAKSTLARAVK